MERQDSLGLHPSFILHRSPYSNSSLLLECLTADQGRFPLIARGAAAAGKNGTMLQPFTPLVISWAGRGEVKTLRNYDVDGKPYNLKGNALYCGFYINELLMRLVHRNDSNPAIFDLYRETLASLSTNDDLEGILRGFELAMLTQLGYGLNLEHDAESGEPVDSNGYYRYEIEVGPVWSASRGDEQRISGKTLIALAKGGEMDKDGRREAKHLLRRIISFYIGDRPLKSRELFRTLGSNN
ncbi:MAG: DNA repair protein RecO [Sedimenticola sp.]